MNLKRNTIIYEPIWLMGRKSQGCCNLPTELGIRATGSESSQLPKGRRASRIKFSFDVPSISVYHLRSFKER